MRNVFMLASLAVMLTGVSRCEHIPRPGHQHGGGGHAGGGSEPDAPFCGGIAGIACPGAGTCVDDPSDSCDPDKGGADCGGLCECSGAAVLCLTGTVFNDDPTVCACEPAPGDGEPCGPNNCAKGQVCCNESCGICTAPGGFCTEQFCEPDPGPEPDPDAPFCGGIAGIACPGAGMCVDNPNDDCDPSNGGADCGGLCTCSGAAVLCIAGTVFNDDPSVCACEGTPDEPAPFCGGIAGFACPGEGECVDNPNDSCDPRNGGADCGGLCECNVGPLIDCISGNVFDDAPDVCACVPTP